MWNNLIRDSCRVMYFNVPVSLIKIGIWKQKNKTTRNVNCNLQCVEIIPVSSYFVEIKVTMRCIVKSCKSKVKVKS